MVLQTIEIFNGVSSLIWICVSIITGLLIALKYFKTYEKVFLYAGIAWMGIGVGWFPTSISFLLTFITGESLSLVMYVLIGNFMVPWVLLVWLAAVTELLYTNKRKIILLIFAIIGIIFDIYLIYSIIYNPNSIAQLESPVDIQYKSLLGLYLIFVITTVLISGILFALRSIKSNEPRVRTRGKFILIAYISYFIGALLDSSVSLNFMALLLIRILLISSSIEFYLGFFLPGKTKEK